MPGTIALAALAVLGTMLLACLIWGPWESWLIVPGVLYVVWQLIEQGKAPW